MITGYVSSDEDDDYDFGYSEPLIRKKESPPSLSLIQSKEIREHLLSELEHSRKVSLFMRAIDEGDLESLEKLIALGVSVDSCEPEEWTPLMKACGKGKVDVVRFLLDHGSDCNNHRELFTPLMACCTYTLIEENLKLSCAELLLQHGAKVNATDKYRTTALMYAIGSGYMEIVNRLLEVQDIDVNIQDKEGWSAIFYAVNHNHIDLVKRLVCAGSDLRFKDRYDRTPLNLALDKDLKETAVALGYNEEQSYICEIVNDENPRRRFLDELPDKNGNGGFTSDAQNILELFNQFKVKKISLPDFLNASDKQLHKLGVKLEHDRRKILKMGIHRYHLNPWKKSSMLQISKGVPMSIENAIAIAGNLVKHLTIANASLKYLDNRILLRLNTEPIDLSVEKELINALVSIYSTAEHTQILLKRILKSIKQIQPPSCADYIQKSENAIKKKIINKYMWCSLSVAAVGCALLYIKIKRSL